MLTTNHRLIEAKPGTDTGIYLARIVEQLVSCYRQVFGPEKWKEAFLKTVRINL